MRVRLRETYDFVSSVEYIALSHCWGGTTSMILNSDSFMKLTTGIALEELPATFRDAVVMANALCIRYVWIDSLCIRQDSQQDWKVQSATMAAVYSHAVLTFAATYSANCHGGLLGQSQDEMVLNPPVAHVNWKGDITINQQSVFLPVSDWHMQVDMAELSTRGWTFQEALLSPRTIHFSADQIRWTCKCLRGSESIYPLAEEMTSSPFAKDTKHDLRHMSWAHIVRQYSGRKLSRTTDIFPALGGLARIFARIHGFTEKDYLAGLWVPQLAYHLLWIPYVGSHLSKAGIAPSWSWASVEGPVNFAALDSLAEHGPLVHPRLQGMNGSTGFPSEASFVHPSVGRVCVRCFLHKVMFSDLRTVPAERQHYHYGKHNVRYYADALFGSRRLQSCAGLQHFDCKYKESRHDCHAWDHFHIGFDDFRNMVYLDDTGSSNDHGRLSGASSSDNRDVLHAYFLPLVSAPAPARVRGLMLQRSTEKAGIYVRIGTMTILAGDRGSPDLRILPEWQHGGLLAPDEYKADHGDGCYEIEII